MCSDSEQTLLGESSLVIEGDSRKGYSFPSQDMAFSGCDAPSGEEGALMLNLAEQEDKKNVGLPLTCLSYSVNLDLSHHTTRCLAM